jgi:hypothetical protein
VEVIEVKRKVLEKPKQWELEESGSVKAAAGSSHPRTRRQIRLKKLTPSLPKMRLLML